MNPNQWQQRPECQPPECYGAQKGCCQPLQVTKNQAPENVQDQADHQELYQCLKPKTTRSYWKPVVLNKDSLDSSNAKNNKSRKRSLDDSQEQQSHRYGSCRPSGSRSCPRITRRNSAVQRLDCMKVKYITINSFLNNELSRFQLSYMERMSRR